MGFDDGLAFGLADDEGGDCTWTDGNWTGFCDVIMGGFGLVIGLEDDGGGCTWTDGNWTGFCDVMIGTGVEELLVVIGRFSIGSAELGLGLAGDEGGGCTWIDESWTGSDGDVMTGAASDVEELVVIGRFSIGWVVLVFRLEDEEGGCCISTDDT